MSVFEQNAVVNDYALKHKKLVAEFAIVSNATPASKKHDPKDLPAVLILRSEGKTAEADAIEVVAFTTAVDNSAGSSVFGVLLRGADFGLGNIGKILSIQVREKTALATSLTVTAHGTFGLTSGGNVAFSIAGAGLNLASESPTIVVEMDYVASK